jgi:hypothetical protein
MTKWARINPEKEEVIQEVITYNPYEIINENFWHLFKECPDEVEKGYFYNPNTETFYLPDGYAKDQNFEIFGYQPIPEGGSVDENGFIILPPPPEPEVIEEPKS